MKLLLTSGGVTNPSIRDALVDMLGKPTADADALCIPTAQWGHPRCGPVSAPGVRQRPAPVGWHDLDSVAPDDRTLGVVDFSIFPHLDVFPQNTIAEAERWATEIGGPAYAIDDQTAIKVTDDTVEVISEGRWKQFPGGYHARR